MQAWRWTHELAILPLHYLHGESDKLPWRTASLLMWHTQILIKRHHCWLDISMKSREIPKRFFFNLQSGFMKQAYDRLIILQNVTARELWLDDPWKELWNWKKELKHVIADADRNYRNIYDGKMINILTCQVVIWIHFQHHKRCFGNCRLCNQGS